MSEDGAALRPLHENLDTAYVDAAALLRYLGERGFEGLVRLVGEDFEAEVILRAGERPAARSRDGASGVSLEGEAALASLFERAARPGGLVSVYEGAVGLEAPEEPAAAGGTAGEAAAGRAELMGLAGELIEAIERAVRVAGGDFEGAAHASRLALAEDYPFLDPFARRFEYSQGEARVAGEVSDPMLLSGLCEFLRGAVEHVATSERRIGVHKDAARELSVLLRRRHSRLARFKLTARHLERIAGMKLL